MYQATLAKYSPAPGPATLGLHAHQAVRRMRCTPESVTTGSLSSPTCARPRAGRCSAAAWSMVQHARGARRTWSAYVASSNGFCICPGPNSPRSPPRLALLQCDSRPASSAKSACPPASWPRKARICCSASSCARARARALGRVAGAALLGAAAAAGPRLRARHGRLLPRAGPA